MAFEFKLRRTPMVLALYLAFIVGLGAGQVSHEFHRTFTVSLVEPVSLQVGLLAGDLHIAYARDGQLSITVTAYPTSDDLESLKGHLVIAQSGNHLQVSDRPAPADQKVRLTYKIDVPYRTEVHSSVQRGKQTIAGIMGPVTAEGGVGDIEVSYISLGANAQVRTGNLSFEAVGGRIEAGTGEGKIACERAPLGISADTEDGDIVLAVVGPSTAIVKSGNGRIDVGGARGSLFASTNAGDLHIKAVPHDDWQLSSISGNIRIELPSEAKFALSASTRSGELVVNRDDLTKPAPDAHEFEVRVNGGGKRIAVTSERGRVVIG